MRARQAATTLVAATSWALLCALAWVSPASAHEGHGAESMESPMLAHNETYLYEANASGTYTFHCHPHPWMTGKLVVLRNADAAGVQVHELAMAEPGGLNDTELMRFEQADGTAAQVTVHLGDRVLWTNHGHALHNVVLEPAAETHAPAPALAAILVVLGAAALAARRMVA